jgi:hypothetical protein
MDALQNRTSSRLTADTPSSARPVTTHTWRLHCNCRCDLSKQTLHAPYHPTVSLAAPAGEAPSTLLTRGQSSTTTSRSPPAAVSCTLGLVVNSTHTGDCTGGVHPPQYVNNTLYTRCQCSDVEYTLGTLTRWGGSDPTFFASGVRMELGEAWCSAFTSGRACGNVHGTTRRMTGGRGVWSRGRKRRETLDRDCKWGVRRVDAWYCLVTQGRPTTVTALAATASHEPRDGQ